MGYRSGAQSNRANDQLWGPALVTRANSRGAEREADGLTRGGQVLQRGMIHEPKVCLEDSRRRLVLGTMLTRSNTAPARAQPLDGGRRCNAWATKAEQIGRAASATRLELHPHRQASPPHVSSPPPMTTSPPAGDALE